MLWCLIGGLYLERVAAEIEGASDLWCRWCFLRFIGVSLVVSGLIEQGRVCDKCGCRGGMERLD